MKKFYGLENCTLRGVQTSAIFYGEWEEVKKLVKGKAKPIRLSKKFESAQQTFFQQTKVNANGYFKYVEDEWIFLTNEEEKDNIK